MPQHADHDDDHDRGLAFDLSTLGRRHVLKLIGGAGLLALVGCGAESGGTSSAMTASTAGSTATTTATSASTAVSADDDCSPIPEETAGPYPGDGSNGPNVLTESGIVRSDIRSSFGGASGVADGVPLTVTLTVQDAACTALPGAAVYLWHCDREGRYSLYSDGVTGENHLRGVQETDADGRVTFSTIFPGAYSGRWPHIHFEVYPSLAEATSAGSTLVTSQLALPEDACNLVYATEGYSESVRTMAQTSLESDNVFGDGYDEQLATVSGDVGSGLTSELTLSVPA
jgi:protocatechuate 3,4-dioxygenase beta subunit